MNILMSTKNMDCVNNLISEDFVDIKYSYVKDY